MALNPIEILKGVIEGYTLTINIDSVDSLGGGEYKLNTSNTYYLRTLKKVTIDSVDYQVTDFSINSYITVKAFSGDVPVTVDSFTVDQPLFVWGNPQMVSVELLKRVKNQTVIWPYIWALEISNTQRSLDPATATPYTPSFNLFFLDSNNKGDWTINDHYNNAIYTLNNYLDTFLTILRSRRDLFDTDSISFTVINHVNFGEYIVDEGMKELILNGEITGIQVQVDIPFTITTCKDITLTPSSCLPATETFNGSSISPIPSGGNKDIVVRDPSLNQVGTIITDTASDLIIEVPPGGDDVSTTYNGIPTATDTPAGSTLAIAGIGSVGLVGTVAIDTPTAKGISIADSPIQLEGVPFADGLPAEGTLNIQLVDSGDNTVASTVITDDSFIKKIEVASTTYDYDIFLNGADTGQNVTIDGTDVTFNLGDY